MKKYKTYKKSFDVKLYSNGDFKLLCDMIKFTSVATDCMLESYFGKNKLKGNEEKSIYQLVGYLKTRYYSGNVHVSKYTIYQYMHRIYWKVRKLVDKHKIHDLFYIKEYISKITKNKMSFKAQVNNGFIKKLLLDPQFKCPGTNIYFKLSEDRFDEYSSRLIDIYNECEVVQVYLSIKPNSLKTKDFENVTASISIIYRKNSDDRDLSGFLILRKKKKDRDILTLKDVKHAQDYNNSLSLDDSDINTIISILGTLFKVAKESKNNKGAIKRDVE